MNILYHHRTMGRGAEGSHIAHIVRAFERAGHDVIVLSPPGVDPLGRVGANPLDKTDEKVSGITRLWRMISRHAPQIFFEMLEVFYNFQAIPRLRRVIRANDIDAVYERSAFFLFAGAYAAKRYGIPLVVEANEAVGIKRARPLLMRKLARFFERYTLTRAKVIFTVSSHLSKMLQDNVSAQKEIHVLPNAIEPEKFSQPTRREQIRNKYKLTGKVVIGFAGWFDWWDRLDMLIAVQSELAKQGYADLVTMLIGHGAMVDDLHRQIADLGIGSNVIMTGAVNKEDVLDYIDALDIGVLPHSNEFGSPMVLFEMMALGKCVVAPDVAPVVDVIKDRENGVVFPRLNQEAMKAGIACLLENPDMRNRIGEKAKERVFANNTWQKNAEKILHAIEG